MANTKASDQGKKGYLKLGIPVIPAWLSLVGVMQVAGNDGLNVGLVMGLSFALAVLALVQLYMIGRSLIPVEQHAGLPKELAIVAIAWALAWVMAASPRWTDDSAASLLQGFSLLTVAMAISYFAKGIGVIDDPDNPF